LEKRKVDPHQTRYIFAYKGSYISETV